MKVKIAYASLPGKDHQKKQIESQDVFREFAFGPCRLLVLSDGAGSKQYALESAELVAEETGEYFRNRKHQKIEAFKAEDYMDFLLEAFEKRGFHGGNSGATVLFCFTDGNSFLVGHLGDGVILHGTESAFDVLSLPENGSVVNQTFLFPSEQDPSHLRVYKGSLNKYEIFIISSDGLANLLYNEETLDTASACFKIAEWAREYSEKELSAILKDNLESVFSNRTNDDISLGIFFAE